MNVTKARVALDWLLRLAAAAGAVLLLTLVADPAAANGGICDSSSLKGLIVRP